jgi:hypothetical protein
MLCEGLTPLAETFDKKGIAFYKSYSDGGEK